MGAIASQITSLTVVYSTIYSDAHQRSASLAFVWGTHRAPVNSPHKWPVTRKMFQFDDVIMKSFYVGHIDPFTLKRQCNCWSCDDARSSQAIILRLNSRSANLVHGQQTCIQRHTKLSRSWKDYIRQKLKRTFWSWNYANYARVSK